MNSVLPLAFSERLSSKCPTQSGLSAPPTDLWNYSRDNSMACGPVCVGWAGSKGSEITMACSLSSSGPQGHIQLKRLFLLPGQLSDKLPAVPLPIPEPFL